MRRGRRLRTKRFRLSGGSIVRLVLIGVCAAGAIWLSVAVGVANILRTSRPDTALRFAPFDAGSKARLAESALADLLTRRRGSSAEAERLSRAALARDPTQVVGWRSLAMTVELRRAQSRARQLFYFTESLSRRDLGTQLWLIEERVRANDIRGALRHYDVALRTSNSAGRLLYPVLIAASTEPAIVDALADFLATNPPWSNDLFAQFATQGAPSPRNLAALLGTLSRRHADLRPETMNVIVNRMVEDRQFEPAWRIASLVRRLGPAEALLRNGGFDAVENASPFDWRYEQGNDLSAEPLVVERAGEGPVLVVRANAGSAGSVARQLLVLRPGAYSISARSGGIPGTPVAKLYWNLVCADNASQMLLQTEPRTAGERGALSGEFRIPPSSCSAQWLVLVGRSDLETDVASAWTDGVTIRRAGSGS
jgi:hypothetical protein